MDKGRYNGRQSPLKIAELRSRISNRLLGLVGMERRNKKV